MRSLGLARRLQAVLRRVEDRHANRPDPAASYPHVASLNDLIGLPTDYRRCTFGDASARAYLLDYNYRDAERSAGCLAALAACRRERGTDYAGKTLLLAARGLDPLSRALLDFVGEFADHHVFFELWNTEGEVAELAEARLSHLYFLPVTAALGRMGPPRPMPRRPNRCVFVSLGGDDEIDLLETVVHLRPDLHFFVPDRRWTKDHAGRHEVDVGIAGPNVTRVPCQPLLGDFTAAYRLAYAWCDTVLIATRRDKRTQMRGGIRVADALAARKRIVMAKNGMCELLMAQHERTCLVADHDAEALAGALEQVVDGRFRVDRDLYEEIRALTHLESKVAWMMRAPQDPEAASRSAFFRGPARLVRDLERLSDPPVPALFGLTRCASLDLAGGQVLVADIRRDGETRHTITLTRNRERTMRLIVSTDAAAKRYCTTGRGHALSYQGTELTPDEARIVAEVARLL